MKSSDTTVRAAVDALKRTTGLEAELRMKGTRDWTELTLRDPVRGNKHTFHIEARLVDRFAIPALIKMRHSQGTTPSILIAPYITREVAERCRQLQMPFVDTAGNAYIDCPGLFVYVTGQPKPSSSDDNQFRSISAAGLQIAFALACRPPLARSPYREIAEAANVSLGAIGPVLKDLEGRGFLVNRAEGRTLVDGRRLVEEWVTYFPVVLRPKLNPRRFSAERENLSRLDLAKHGAYWGGEVAAERLTHHLRPALFTIYTSQAIAKLAAAGRMRADLNGNVEVLDRFWHFKSNTDEHEVVPPILAYADLLASHDSRNAEAAQVLYEQRIAPAFGSVESFA